MSLHEARHYLLLSTLCRDMDTVYTLSQKKFHSSWPGLNRKTEIIKLFNMITETINYPFSAHFLTAAPFFVPRMVIFNSTYLCMVNLQIEINLLQSNHTRHNKENSSAITFKYYHFYWNSQVHFTTMLMHHMINGQNHWPLWTTFGVIIYKSQFATISTNSWTRARRWNFWFAPFTNS